jgi:hypothetical protein
VLDEDHYGLKDVKDRVVEFLAVRQLRAQQLAEEMDRTGEFPIARLQAPKEDATATPGGPEKRRIGPLAIARAFASRLSVMVRSLSSPFDFLGAAVAVASSLGACSLAIGNSPVRSISSASCCARSCRAP